MENQKMAKIFRALSNPKRLELYLSIAEANEKTIKTCCCCCSCCSCCSHFITNILDCMNISAPTSLQVKELANAGLINTVKKGKTITCKINKEMVAEVRQILDKG